VSRPLIAVSARHRNPGEVSGWSDLPAAVMQRSYLEGIWRAGCLEAMIAPRSLTDNEADDLLARMDGLVLVGGGDIDPAHYGQDAHPEVYGVNALSDALELTLVKAAVRARIPTLAICRGMQVLNVALGGTLCQHLDPADGWDIHRGPLHRIDVEPGSRIAAVAAPFDEAWSWHHQAVDQPGAGLVITGRAEDGCVEAVELDSRDTWIVGVQWHPERTAHTDAQQQGLFEALGEQARSYRR
jgi:putative glutamine amidotransferase